MKIQNFRFFHDFCLMNQTPCPRTTWATICLRTPYLAKINLHTRVDRKQICTTDVHKVYLIKNKQNRPQGNQSPECHRDVQSPSAPYYSSSYRSTSHVLIVWDIGGSNRQVWAAGRPEMFEKKCTNGSIFIKLINFVFTKQTNLN